MCIKMWITTPKNAKLSTDSSLSLSFLLPPRIETGQEENHCADDDSDIILAEESFRAAVLYLCAECQSDEHDDEEIRDLPEH